ncbi:MAG: hypothetical protein U1A77_18865 [Pirellulales bacterium]
MPPKFFTAFFDPEIGPQWYLGKPIDRGGTEIQAVQFTSGQSYRGPPPHSVKIYQAGPPTEVSFGWMNLPVFSDSARSAIESVAAQDCEFFTIDIQGTGRPWHILNAIALVDCFDVNRSEFEQEGEGDQAEYDWVYKLVIDPARVGPHELFRIRGYALDLIVSEKVKAAIERLPRHGVSFKCVTP